VSKLVDLGGKTDPGAPSPPLIISCNGQKIFLKGANWGMDEGMLRCDREGFEDRIRYEKDMNFTMILSNLGHVGKQDFFDECDRAGIFIWEEFGVNHDNMPYDVDMWLANARDRVLTKRNHACVALWCTANEGSSHEPILTAVPKLVDELDGTRLFLQHSTQHPPTDGDGPYEAYSPVFYMGGLAHGFRPEIGSPMVPAIESVRRMMPHNKLWPIGPMWGTHDWWQKGFETGDGTCGKTEKAVAGYGAATGIEDFCRKAQMVSLETLKAIFEAWNDKLWDNCTGVIIWMSNPVWPDLYWNTYDYYMEPTAGYFGCKKGCEPIHIQWSMASNNVKVVNNTLKPLHGVHAEAHVYNLDGSLHLKKSVALDCTSNNVHTCFNLFADDDPKSARLSDVYFIRLELKDASGLTLSNNFYWNAKEVWKYKDLASMNKAEVRGTVKKAFEGETCKFTVSVANTNKAVALMVRIKLMDPVTGLLVAPVIYSENYFSLIPGESRQIALECRAKKVAGKEVKVMVEGWNVTSKELPLA
jgi:beta-galactosidase/beta-glucuronidase